ncbi:hypothetical protein [Streptomyces sp. NPDC046985]|uniref:hypothetical protein n=1 Tax=Streptomyces sp. NPDC046985 TaxID=3155377 RepID=UPI0033C91D58
MLAPAQLAALLDPAGYTGAAGPLVDWALAARRACDGIARGPPRRSPPAGPGPTSSDARGRLLTPHPLNVDTADPVGRRGRGALDDDAGAGKGG